MLGLVVGRVLADAVEMLVSVVEAVRLAAMTMCVSFIRIHFLRFTPKSGQWLRGHCGRGQ